MIAPGTDDQLFPCTLSSTLALRIALGMRIWVTLSVDSDQSETAGLVMQRKAVTNMECRLAVPRDREMRPNARKYRCGLVLIFDRADRRWVEHVGVTSAAELGYPAGSTAWDTAWWLAGKGYCGHR